MPTNSEVYPMLAYIYGRFSSKPQAEGDSYARQMELAERWCKDKHISIDQSLVFFDKGVSGASGKHRTKGALSLFLAACEQGRVARGSYLLVENIDRLTRENLFVGQQLIRDLLDKYRIVLILTSNLMEFTRENYGHTHYYLDAEFDRAHRESQRKAEFSTRNWEQRRRKKVLTKKCPFWLEWDGSAFKVNETKAAVVRRIYEFSKSGFGCYKIAKHLNKCETPVFGEKGRKAVAWHQATIAKILASRATRGEFQPRKKNEHGVYEPIGEVRKDYYPAIVSHETWLAAQRSKTTRKRGRCGSKVSNLFTGLVYMGGMRCAYHILGGVGYLCRIDRAALGVRYDSFERVFLWWVRDAQLTLTQEGNYAEVKEAADELAKSIAALEGKIKSNPALVSMVDTLIEWKATHKTLEEKLQSLEVPTQTHFLHSKNLILAMYHAEKGFKLETMRRELRQVIGSVVRRVEVIRGEPTEEFDMRTHVTVTVHMVDGQSQAFYYCTKNGRVVDGGCHFHTSEGTVSIVDKLKQSRTYPIERDGAEEKAKKIAKEFASGKSRKELAEQEGISPTAVSRRLARARRAKGEPTGAEARTAAKEARRAECVRLSAEGKSNKEIAAALGIHPVTVSVLLNGR